MKFNEMEYVSMISSAYGNACCHGSITFSPFDFDHTQPGSGAGQEPSSLQRPKNAFICIALFAKPQYFIINSFIWRTGASS